MYQTKFSKYFPLTDEHELRWVEEELEKRQHNAYWSSGGFFAYKLSTGGVWIHSSAQSPIVDDIAEVEKFLQDFLIRFRPGDIISLEYAFCADDSSFTTNEQQFGGGASVITAREIYSTSTDVWIEQRIRTLRDAGLTK